MNAKALAIKKQHGLDVTCYENARFLSALKGHSYNWEEALAQASIKLHNSFQPRLEQAISICIHFLNEMV
jgi:hypothetical protein